MKVVRGIQPFTLVLYSHWKLLPLIQKGLFVTPKSAICYKCLPSCYGETSIQQVNGVEINWVKQALCLALAPHGYCSEVRESHYLMKNLNIALMSRDFKMGIVKFMEDLSVHDWPPWWSCITFRSQWLCTSCWGATTVECYWFNTLLLGFPGRRVLDICFDTAGSCYVHM